MSHADLLDAFDAFRHVVSELESSPEGAQPAADLRERATLWLRSAVDSALGRQIRACPKHRGQQASNCGACRADRIAVPDTYRRTA